MTLINKKTLWIALGLGMGSWGSIGAETYHQANIRFVQSTSEINNGLLSRGPQAGYTFGIKSIRDKSIFEYSLNIEVNHMRSKGVGGLGFEFKPVDLSWRFNIIGFGRSALYAGVSFESDYRFGLSPNLQMGHLLWLTQYSISPQIAYELPISESILRFHFGFSVLNLWSQTESIAPYYFSLRFGDIVSNMHSNMHFGSMNKVNKFDMGVEYQFSSTKRQFSIAYQLNYVVLHSNHRYEELQHAMTLRTSKK